MELNRDAELTNLLNSESGRETVKEADRKAFSKNKWLSQLITLKLKDNEGNVQPGCEWKIQRRKLTAKTVQDCVTKGPVKVEVDYVYDSSGAAITFDQLLKEAQPDPEFYFIVPKVRRVPFDIANDPKYEGQMSFVISRVPLRTKDEQNEVDGITLKEWLVFALLEVDPYSQPFYRNLEKIKAEIAVIDKKIKGIPKMEFNDSDGNGLSPAEADAERETLYTAYAEERVACDKRYKRQEAALEGHRQWRRNMGIQFIKGEVDRNTETATWFVRFYGTKDAQEMENLLIKKDDWAAIKLARHNPYMNPPLPPWAGREDVPDGSKSFLADYRPLQVNISGAIIRRVPHGVGTYRTLDRRSSKYADDDFSFYYGEWYDGYKHGRGIEVDDSGVYSGTFVHGFRNGQGRIDYCNGTVLLTEFSVLQQHKDRQTGPFRNPYMDGESQGYAELLFADGAFFKGVMTNGCPSGRGEYESAFGEKTKGTFKEGCLDGENGFFQNYAGEKFFGHWKMGELHGRGSYTNDRGDSYIGYWENFLKHGRGKEFFKNRGSYRGYFINGTRNGKGELEYIKRKQLAKKNVVVPESKDTAGTEPIDKRPALIPDFKYRYQGFLIGNNVTSGGIVMDTLREVPKGISKRDKVGLYPLVSFLSKVEKATKEYKKKVEKFTDMEHHVRKDVDYKKTKVFRQQKHFTKKAIYEDESKPYRAGRLSVRDNVRNARLEKAFPYQVNSKKGIVPTWTSVDIKKAKHLKEEFSKIVVQKQKGEKKKIKTIIPRLVISDFEEATEKQRLIKYDLLWTRAEQVFMDKKKELANLHK